MNIEDVKTKQDLREYTQYLSDQYDKWCLIYDTNTYQDYGKTSENILNLMGYYEGRLDMINELIICNLIRCSHGTST